MPLSQGGTINMTKIYHCYRCNQTIEFTSEVSETPKGFPTKDPLTQKYKALDPFTKEYHECKDEDIAAYKVTSEYQNKIAERKANQGALNIGNTGITTHNSINSEQPQQSSPSKGEDLF